MILSSNLIYAETFLWKLPPGVAKTEEPPFAAIHIRILLLHSQYFSVFSLFPSLVISALSYHYVRSHPLTSAVSTPLLPILFASSISPIFSEVTKLPKGTAFELLSKYSLLSIFYFKCFILYLSSDFHSGFFQGVISDWNGVHISQNVAPCNISKGLCPVQESMREFDDLGSAQASTASLGIVAFK